MNALAGGLAALLLGVAGCGTEAGGGGTSGGSAPGEPATSLTVVVYPNGMGKEPSHETTIECDPVGGTNPLTAESCVQLAAHPESLEPVPPDTACTMIYGGPEEAHVYGTFQGEEVDATFSRSNGCEIARWDSLEPLFKVVVD